MASEFPSHPAGILYISYDGMLEPLGQSQVIAYLERLAGNRRIHLLSFEKSQDWGDIQRRRRVRGRLQAAGIYWHPRRYHKSPSSLATAWDIVIGTLSALWLVLRHRLRIVHARSYVPGMMALVSKHLTGAKFLFDMRGFWVDERVDGGLWSSNGRLYRFAKWAERRCLLGADYVVSLTRAGVREMQGFDYLQARMPPTEVIPTCADLERFRPVDGQRSEHFTLGYVGSAGTWYLFDAAVACFRELRRLQPGARWLLLNRGEHDYIRERLLAGGVPLEAVELRDADHSEVPAQMARMHAGIFFIKPVFSKQASAPTKLGEFLGCGIPCLGNSGVGDMAGILQDKRVGVALAAFDQASLLQGLHRLIELTRDPDIQARCVAAAEQNFSLTEGVRRYAALYSRLEEA